MKNRLILLFLVLVVITGLEIIALLSKPKVNFKIDNPENAAEKVDASLKPANLPILTQVENNFDKPVLLEEQGKVATIFNLELIGTAIGNAKDPSAFIRDLNSGKQAIYKLGCMLGEAKVTKISMGKVVLELDGKEQILTMSKRGRAWAHLDEDSERFITIAGDQILVNKSALLSESGKIISDLKQVRVSPYMESMKVAGLKVEGITPDSIIASAGIRDKDVVTMVNSQKIDSYQKALQVLNKAKGQGEIKVNVLRDGQPQLLCYKLQ